MPTGHLWGTNLQTESFLLLFKIYRTRFDYKGDCDKIDVFVLYATFWKILLLPVRAWFLQNKWRYQSSYITRGLEIITFTRVYENLEFSVNEELVAYGTLVQILVTLKSPVPMDAIWYKTVSLLLEGCIWPNIFGNKFLLL